MTTEFSILAFTVISIALVHTLSGPDHYLPFIMISKAKSWNIKKTIFFTALCGFGHVGSSVVLGLIGLSVGIAVGKLELWEGMRGTIVSWLFTAFGLIYMMWGIRQVYRKKKHSHQHFHIGTGLHTHEHSHHHEHTHVHIPLGLEINKDRIENIQGPELCLPEKKQVKNNLSPWILFIIFIFGPCEPLIPIVMYPAAKHNYMQMLILTALFSLITIMTMIILVTAAYYGTNFITTKKLEKHYHALAGGTIFLCGLGMITLDL